MLRNSVSWAGALVMAALMGLSPAPAAAQEPGAGAAPTGAAEGLGSQALAAQGAAGVVWRACGGEGVPAGMECGAIDVPVDWSRPGGKQVRLELARLRATEPAARVGSVLGVPGGPGRDGIEDLKLAAPHLTELRRRFDLVAYRPRSTVWGTTAAPSCWEPGVALRDPRDRRAYEAVAAAMAKAFAACRADDTTGLLGHLDGLSIARDMEAVRRALGEERLSLMANSYGGVVAAAYIRLFPQRIRAMYLDGVVNQTEGWPMVNLVTRAGSEQALERFGRWCAATPACALHGEDAADVWRRLTRAADRKPIPVTSQQFGEGELTGWHLRNFGFVPDPGPDHARWLALAEWTDKARHGDGSGFADFALGNTRAWATPVVLAMSCGDGRGYTGWAQLRQYRRDVREVAPSFPGAAFDQVGCIGWPEPVANPPRPLEVRGLPPMLGAGALEGDFSWTERFIRMVPGSVTVGYDGPGHVLYLSGRKCPIAHATAYLTELRLPAPGTICPAE
ncbi:alpha/beta hydrolase [Nonomuraea sp. FMUSA5-5]|uniref:Alpha/beta hydrolase n=1 Tax=Nonomuraea composti TaxID=2720023 RepID=A0ABX1BCU7_9ACTN|nr:alpha/beta fold hydrolase [Nonomuraea sp. FMUSA5-5]NJP94637.1 alpha/beta hydrolase [Nonomuraea sp. FMUSA5-5]